MRELGGVEAMEEVETVKIVDHEDWEDRWAPWVVFTSLDWLPCARNQGRTVW